MFSRRFTLRHTFENMSELDEAEGPVETHFGVSWNIEVQQKFGEYRNVLHRRKRLSWLVVYLYCHRRGGHPWSVSVKGTIRIDNENDEDNIEETVEGEYDDDREFKIEKSWDWDTMLDKYVKNDKLTVEIDVVITEMKGIVPKRKISFAEPEADISDVVLAVGDRKFHVSKVILGKFSDFFKLLFFTPGYKESKQSEIKLEGVDPDTFQMILEVIYGELENIQEETVEDILHLARQYQVRVVTNRCIDFMIDKADVPLDKKFRLASTYNLMELQDHLLENIKSKKDSDDRLTKSSKYMSDSFIAKMIRKVYE